MCCGGEEEGMDANPVGGDVTGVEAVSQLRHAQSDELVDQGEGHLVKRRRTMEWRRMGRERVSKL